MPTVLNNCPSDLQNTLRLLRLDPNQLSLSLPGSIGTYIEVRSPNPLSPQELTAENDHLLVIPTDKTKIILARPRELIIPVETQLPKALGSYLPWDSASRYGTNSETPVVQEYPNYTRNQVEHDWIRESARLIQEEEDRWIFTMLEDAARAIGVGTNPEETTMPIITQDSIGHGVLREQMNGVLREQMRSIEEREDRVVRSMWESAARAIEASARQNLFQVADLLEEPTAPVLETIRITLRRNRFSRILCE